MANNDNYWIRRPEATYTFPWIKGSIQVIQDALDPHYWVQLGVDERKKEINLSLNILETIKSGLETGAGNGFDEKHREILLDLADDAIFKIAEELSLASVDELNRDETEFMEERNRNMSKADKLRKEEKIREIAKKHNNKSHWKPSTQDREGKRRKLYNQLA